MSKRHLRKAVRERITAFSPHEMAERSSAACRLLCEQPEYRSADVLMVFLPTPFEVDTAPLATRAWTDQKRVAAPRVSREQRRMLPIEIRSLTSGLDEGSFGFVEPVVVMPFPVGDIDLLIVPGMAFDGLGNRLGRGRGFYDRFLAHHELRAVVCGMAFEQQFVEHVPTDQNDLPVHMLVTDVRVRRFAAPQQG